MITPTTTSIKSIKGTCNLLTNSSGQTAIVRGTEPYWKTTDKFTAEELTGVVYEGKLRAARSST